MGSIAGGLGVEKVGVTRPALKLGLGKGRFPESGFSIVSGGFADGEGVPLDLEIQRSSDMYFRMF